MSFVDAGQFAELILLKKNVKVKSVKNARSKFSFLLKFFNETYVDMVGWQEATKSNVLC